MLSFTLSFFPYFCFSLNNFFFKNQVWFSLILNLTKNWFNVFFCFTIVFFLVQRWSIFIYVYLYKFVIFTIFVKKKLITTQLLMGFNNIHPILFYISFFLLFISYGDIETIFFIKRLNNLMIGVFALLLGGWWGLGNSVWGFFWVNDLIECILFGILCWATIYMHCLFYKEVVVRYLLGFLTAILLLLMLRWGFLFTRHNFFSILALNNLIIFFFFRFNIFYFYLLYLYVTFFSIGIIVMFFFILFLHLYKKLNIFLFKLICWHIFFFIIGFSWLKFKEHMSTIFTFLYVSNLNYILFSLKQQYFFSKFFIGGGGSLLLFSISTFFIYGKKFFYITYFLIITYHIFIFLIIFVKSMLKIYNR